MFTKTIVLAASVFLVFFCILLLFLYPDVELVEERIHKPKNILLIEADTDFTKVHLYHWNKQGSESGWSVSVTESCATVGLEENLDYQGNVRQAMECFRNLVDKLSAERPGNTSIYVVFSAGMRIQSLRNTKEASELPINVMNLIKETAQDEKLISENVLLDLKGIEILSSRQEAAFTWLAANTLNGMSKDGQTFGILDMSPLFTKIAFQTNPSRISDVEAIKVGLNVIPVKARTNLCYGYETIVAKYLVTLIILNSGSHQMIDPCLNKGAKRSLSTAEIQASICSKPNLNYESLFKEEQIFTFEGTGDPLHCMNVLKELFDARECRSFFTYCYSVDKSKVPNDTKIVVSEPIKELTSVLQLSDETTATQFLDQTKTYCRQGWNEIAKLGKFHPKFHENHCTLLSYLYLYLNNILKFEDSNWRKTNFKYQPETPATVSPRGWPLGFILNSTKPEKGTEIITYGKVAGLGAPSIWLLLILLLVFSILAYYLALGLFTQEHKTALKMQSKLSPLLLDHHKDHHNTNGAQILVFT